MEEAMKYTIIGLKNLGMEAAAWFDELFPPETRPEMFNHCLHITQSYLIAAVEFSGESIKFLVQKLKETPLALKISGQEAWAWFDEAYPPETRAEMISQWRHTAQSYLTAAVDLMKEATQFTLQMLKNSGVQGYLIAAVLVVVGVKLCRCGGGPVKMMKAPGRNLRMPRARFEENPRGYFRDLRTRK